ncbi:MAG: hypothetical protein WD645_03175, partial [Dehalococcoidia bacterium]
AINSAAHLLASANEAHPNGLGNSSGVVGRHLMLHNNSSLIALSKIPNPTKFQKTLGINDFQAGGSGADRMSATAAAVVDGNATLRGSDKRWQVERATSDTGLRMLLLCQEFLDEQMALRIVGPDGKVEWLNVTKEDLIGEFGVSVTSGSTMAVNPATKMQRALDVMTEIIPALAAEGFDTQPFWREALRDYGMDPDRMLRRLPPPPPEGAPPGAEGAGAPPPTVPQEGFGGPPVPAAVEGDVAL